MKLKSIAIATLAAYGMIGGAYAQQPQDAQKIERVEVTGSSIKRVDAEGALPVQVLRREDIDRSGAKSVTELIQVLPVFQNFTTSGDSVGGGGAGFAGAALRNLGETRTLVLLNGKRIAPSGSQALTGAQAAVNLNNLPVAAIERVEILTDGASALYGSDAIGGVVNFITRRDIDFGEVQAGFSIPDKGKGKEYNFSATKGFGSLEQNGFNFLVSVSRDDRDPLKSTDREYAKSGQFEFTENGQRYRFQLGSPRGIPANYVDPNSGELISPFRQANGACPPQHFPVGDTACYYDFTTQLEIFPEQVRDNAVFSLTKPFGEHTLSADVLYSKSKTTSRLAPPPGEVEFDLAGLGVVTVPYRVADVGKRTTQDTSTATHYSIELKGPLAGWDYATSFTRSQSKYEEILQGGWVQLNPFFEALFTPGLIDPFVGPGQQSAAGQAALNNSVIKGKFDGGKTTTDFFELRGSRPLFKLNGGDVQLATGVNYLKEKFDKTPSLLAQGIAPDPANPSQCLLDTSTPDPNDCVADTRFGDSAAIIPYSSTRNSTGVFAELLIPVTKQFEISPSVRYDKYSDFGNTTNYKLSTRFQPTKQILLRGSVGTGFKAPTVPQLNAANQDFGVTGGSYSCTPEILAIASSLGLGSSVAQACPPGSGSAGGVQFNVIAGGNKQLQPEESKQWTLGIRLEPSDNFSIGADLWEVKLDNVIGSIDESTVFANPSRYTQSFTTYTDLGLQRSWVAFFAGNVNLGKSKTSGVDIDTQARIPLSFGKLSSQLVATYIIKNDFELVPDEGYFSDVGKYFNGGPTLRFQARLINTLDHGNFGHTLSINYKSGYADDPDAVVTNLTTGEDENLQRRVASYTTADWQTRWQITKEWRATLGVINLFNKKPPLTITENAGGQMVGYDARFYDSRDRTIYGSVNFKF
jgi:iron complex outermembrane recepter protein